MKRMHLNVKVSDMEKSKAFYSKLFATEPAVEKDDYIKWMVDDPFINFSIEPTTGEVGIAHVGIQAGEPEELKEVYERVTAAAGPKFEEGETTCCYASSEKNWTADPDGLIWEAFYTEGQVTHYGKLPELDGAVISGGENQPVPCCLK